MDVWLAERLGEDHGLDLHWETADGHLLLGRRSRALAGRHGGRRQGVVVWWCGGVREMGRRRRRESARDGEGGREGKGQREKERARVRGRERERAICSREEKVVESWRAPLDGDVVYSFTSCAAVEEAEGASQFKWGGSDNFKGV